MSQDVTPPPEHPMLAALGVLESGVGAPVDGNAWSMSTDDIGEFIDRLAALKHGWPPVSCRWWPRSTGATSGWPPRPALPGACGPWCEHPREANERVRVAQAVQWDCAATGVALAQAAVTAGQAQGDHPGDVIAAAG
ncbi:MAG: hypothetical protein ABJA34_08760 [Pseudonocardiales bacterium]